MKITARKIAAAARRELGRAARQCRFPDWDAAEIVKHCAVEAGCPPVSAWIRPRRSLRQLAEDYLQRCTQAYGIAAVNHPNAERIALGTYSPGSLRLLGLEQVL